MIRTTPGNPVLQTWRPWTSLALIVHELVTKAIKHGALLNPCGSVTIITRCDCDACELAWVERGGPAVDTPPVRTGVGFQVLHRSVTGPFGGTVT